MAWRFGATWAALTAIGVLLAPARVFAQAASFDVPAECGTESEFRDGLTRLLGAASERAWPTTLVIARDASGSQFQLTLEVDGEKRELLHADCRVLFRSALVIAAVTVDPTLRIPDEPTAPPPAPPAPPPRPAPAPPKPRDEAKDSGPPLRGHVAAGGGLALGVLPGATGVVELRGGVARGRFGATLGAQYFFPKDASSEGRTATLQGVGVRAAASFAPTPLVAISAGLSTDWLVGRGGAGLSSPVQDSAWALAPSLELALTPALTRELALELGAAGQLNLLRPTFEVTGFRQIYQMPLASLLVVGRGVFHFL